MDHELELKARTSALELAQLAGAVMYENDNHAALVSEHVVARAEAYFKFLAPASQPARQRAAKQGD